MYVEIAQNHPIKFRLTKSYKHNLMTMMKDKHNLI